MNGRKRLESLQENEKELKKKFADLVKKREKLREEQINRKTATGMLKQKNLP